VPALHCGHRQPLVTIIALYPQNPETLGIALGDSVFSKTCLFAIYQWSILIYFDFLSLSKSLCVIWPRTIEELPPDRSPKPELAVFAPTCPDHRTTRLQRAAATVHKVRDVLGNTPYNHLNHHASSCWDNPLESALQLANGHPSIGQASSAKAVPSFSTF
jgi:hypothetical protein